MSSVENSTKAVSSEIPRKRVMGFVDGFNLYHALQDFRPAFPVPDPDRFRKYKWLCLTQLIDIFVRPKSEVLVGVEYFTALPNWPNSAAKRLRHQTYIDAQEHMGVRVTQGEFKPKEVKCLARCGYVFETYVEKQTDINISTAMQASAGEYDRAILLTADADQVPTINLLKRLHPEKVYAVLPPIGRGAKALKKVSHEYLTMTEDHLSRCQLPYLIQATEASSEASQRFIVKPSTWS